MSRTILIPVHSKTTAFCYVTPMTLTNIQEYSAASIFWINKVIFYTMKTEAVDSSKTFIFIRLYIIFLDDMTPNF
jgi:hypothetical protein